MNLDVDCSYYYDNEACHYSFQEFTLYTAFLVELHKSHYLLVRLKLNDRIKDATRRVENALIKFAREKGTEMAGALVQDMAKKVGLEETLKVGKEIFKTYKGEKSVTMLAQEYVSQNKQDEPVLSYVGVFQSLAEEFKEKSFVLIFDQFESAGKASIDFLINFAKLMPDRFHIMVSFKVEERVWSDTVARKLYEDARDSILELDCGRELRLDGLSADDIGKWIKFVRHVEFPLVPDLQRIRENSAVCMVKADAVSMTRLQFC